MNNLLKQAILNGKTKVTIEGTTFLLPSPQTSGTLKQQNSYAQQCADKLEERFVNNRTQKQIDYYN